MLSAYIPDEELLARGRRGLSVERKESRGAPCRRQRRVGESEGGGRVLVKKGDEENGKTVSKRENTASKGSAHFKDPTDWGQGDVLMGMGSDPQQAQIPQIAACSSVEKQQQHGYVCVVFG